jgi:putative transposase
VGVEVTIRQGYRYGLAPTVEQEAFLRACTGASRFWFNHGLALVKERLDQRAAGNDVDVPWSYAGLCSQIPASDRARVAPWQREVVCGCYQAGFWALGDALRRFSEGRREGRRVGFPRFKLKGRCRESVIFQRPRILDNRRVELDRRCGPIRCKEKLSRLTRLLERDPDARVLRATLTLTAAGKWFVCFTVERWPSGARPGAPERWWESISGCGAWPRCPPGNPLLTAVP